MNGKELNIAPSMRFTLADGQVGTEQTIAAMAAIVHSTDYSRDVKQLAERISGMHPQNPIQQMREVFHWFKQNVKFRRDPKGVEILSHPDQILEELVKTATSPDPRVEIDCKKASVLGASLLRQMKFRPLFVVMGRRADGPYEHVYWGAIVNNVPFHLDPQETPMPFMRARGIRERTFTV